MSHKQKRKTVFHTSDRARRVPHRDRPYRRARAGPAVPLQPRSGRDRGPKIRSAPPRKKVGERIRHLDSQSAGLVGVLAHYHELATFPGPDRLRLALPLLGGAMENNPYLYAIYVGYDTGDFIELANLESGDNVRKTFDAAMIDRWVRHQRHHGKRYPRKRP